MPRRAHARSSSGFAAGGRAHEHEVDHGAVGQVVDAAPPCRCRGPSPPSRLVAYDLARVALAQDVVQRDEPELAGMARRAGDDHAARVEQRAACCVGAGSSARHRATSTSASTAIGRPSTTISGLRSTRHDVGPGFGERGEPEERRRRARSRSTAGSPRNAPSSAWVARSSISSSASTSVERHEPERDVGDRLGEDAADAEHHARPELRVGVQPGDELAVAAHHRRDEQLDRRRRRAWRRASSSAAAARPRPRRARFEAHQPALGLVGDRVAARASPPPGSRASAAAATASSASATRALVEHGDAVLGEQALRVGFGEGRRRRGLIGPPTLRPPTAQTAWLRSFQYSSRRTRFSSLPESVRGSSSRSS